MATHDIAMKIPQLVFVLKTDVEIEIRENGSLLGTLHISKGSIDWKPRKKQHGLRLGWSRFDTLMQAHAKKVPSV
jgi:hypothetical protein